MWLTWLIFIVVIISILKKRSGKGQKWEELIEQAKQNTSGGYAQQEIKRQIEARTPAQQIPGQMTMYQDNRQGQRNAKPAAIPQPVARPQQNPRKMTTEDKARLEQYRSAKAAKGDILSRAQQNAGKYEKDATLEQLEQEHNHSERVKETISAEELAQKKAAHPHDASHVSEFVGAGGDSLLGSLDDLMIKGYSGNLSFERDFVGEGLDMINRFTIPDTIPNTSKEA